MDIHVHLHGILRDKLSSDAKGKTTLTLKEGDHLSGVVAWLEQIGISRRYELAVNGQIDLNDVILKDGDRIDVFIAAAGGQGPIEKGL